MNEALQKLEVKVENEGATPQGRLSSAEWNVVVSALKAIDAGDGGLGKDAILNAVREAGYVTRSDVNTIFSEDAVRVSVAQNISAQHNFTNGIKINNLAISQSQGDTIFIDANVVVRGGITARGTNTTQSPSLFDALPIDGRTIKRDSNGMLYVDADELGISGGGGGGSAEVTYDSVISALGYTPLSTGGGVINGNLRVNKYLSVGAGIGQANVARAQLDVISADANPSDITMGADSQRYWGLTARNATGSIGKAFGIYSYTASSYALFVTETNNVAIGGITADEKLHVYGNVKTNGHLWINSGTYITNRASLILNSTNAPADIIFKSNSTTTGNYGYWAISSRSGEDGRFSIFRGNENSGNSSEGELFVINANGTFSLGGSASIYGNLASTGDITSRGNILATGGITGRYTSDRRLKENIRKFSASKILMSLGGVFQFEYADSEVAKNNIYGGSHIGLIYQNVQGTALDRMCHENDNGYGSLNYLEPSFISLIAGATMENVDEIAKLKKENRVLRKRIEQLEKRV